MEVGRGGYLARSGCWRWEYEWMNQSGARCNLLTGEERFSSKAPAHQLHGGKAEPGAVLPVAVIDEVQLLADPQRGAAWTRAILGLKCPEIHVCGALSARDHWFA
jgi:ATP-dependent RNA helicase SUPV3L1/SUV3